MSPKSGFLKVFLRNLKKPIIWTFYVFKLFVKNTKIIPIDFTITSIAMLYMDQTKRVNKTRY